MNLPGVDPIALQRSFYVETADAYDDTHEAAEHDLALAHVVGLIRWLGARTMLDTGCGTARAMRIIGAALPELEICGNDPSQALLDVASEKFGVSPGRLDCFPTEDLPYSSESFDVVVATGLMHHVPDPQVVIANMLRVARQAVFISDCNMYGQGSLAARAAKLALSRTRLLGVTNRVRRGGHEWVYMEGDGVAWNYSVFDSVDQVRAGCAEVLVIPTTGRTDPRTPSHPLLRCSHALLCGFKSPLPRYVA